jgi:threonine dehydrogenase-like Zn-dependent dehydrogenase
MNAIRSFGYKDVRLVDAPKPVIKPDQVLIAVKGSGICGSDKGMWYAKEASSVIYGHEAAGEVLEIGSAVRYLRIGDRVAVNNVGGCGLCPACRAGAFVRYPSWDGSLDVNGGFGEFVAAWERNCMKLDGSLDYETGCLIFDNFGTPYCALNRGEVKHGDDVIILGCGPIGLAAVMLARVHGAFVIAVDPVESRRAFALRLGARAALAPDGRLPAAVRELTSGIGASVAVECSGNGAAYGIGLSLLRVGGVLVSVGEHAHVDLNPSDQVIRRNLSIAGSWYSGMQDGREVQDLIVRGKIDPKVLVNLRGGLADFPALFKKVCEEPESVVKAVVLNP